MDSETPELDGNGWIIGGEYAIVNWMEMDG